MEMTFNPAFAVSLELPQPQSWQQKRPILFLTIDINLYLHNTEARFVTVRNSSSIFAFLFASTTLLPSWAPLFGPRS